MSGVVKTVSKAVSGVGKALGLVPSAPKALPAPSAPPQADMAAMEAAGAAAAATRRRTRTQSGRAATMLSAQGGSYEDPNIGTKKLLGS